MIVVVECLVAFTIISLLMIVVVDGGGGDVVGAR
jgi:hypothetical protein